MHFVFLNTSLNCIAETPFKSDYAFTPPNREPAGLSEKLWTTLSTELHGVIFSNTIIPKRFILISKFLFPYSIFPKYTTWLNYVFVLLTYIHLLISFFNDTFVGVMAWHRVCNRNFRWMHNETLSTQTEFGCTHESHNMNLVFVW